MKVVKETYSDNINTNGRYYSFSHMRVTNNTIYCVVDYKLYYYHKYKII